MLNVNEHASWVQEEGSLESEYQHNFEAKSIHVFQLCRRNIIQYIYATSFTCVQPMCSSNLVCISPWRKHTTLKWCGGFIFPRTDYAKCRSFIIEQMHWLWWRNQWFVSIWLQKRVEKTHWSSLQVPCKHSNTHLYPPPTHTPCTYQTNPSSPSHSHLQPTTTASLPDYYEVLGVAAEASDRDIKAAFRKKALKFHPDVNRSPNAQETFMRYKDAYQVLSNATERQSYDRLRRMGGTARSSSSSSGGVYDDLFNSAFRNKTTSSSSSSSNKKASTSRGSDEDNYNLEDLLRDLDRDIAEFEKRVSFGLICFTHSLLAVLTIPSQPSFCISLSCP